MEADILITAMLATSIVLIISQLVRLRRTSILHKTIREAISHDSDAVPGLLEGIVEPPNSNRNDDRTGLVLLAIAAALFLFGLIQGDAEDIRNMGGIAVFPALVGAVLVGLHRYIQRNPTAR